MKTRGIYTLMVILAMGSLAHAQNSATTSSAKSSEVTAEAKKPEKRLGLRLGIQSATNMLEGDQYEKSYENTYTLIPSFKISNALSLSAAGNFVQNLRHSEESDFTNTKIKASLKALEIIPEALTYAPAATGTVPTNKEVRDTTSLRGAVGIEQALALDLKKWKIPVSLSYALGLNRNFHEWDRSNTGSPNIAYSMANTIGAGVESGRTSLSVSGMLSTGLTYTDTVRSKFEISEELGYQLSDAAGLVIGHSNGGGTLKSDMNSSNIEFYNANTSTIYAGLQVVY